MAKDKTVVSTIELKAENPVQVPVVASQDQYFGLIQIAVEKGVDIVQLEKLMDLQERAEANQARRYFNIAMSKFQSLLPVIEKNGVVDYTTAKGRTYYEYAKLEDIALAIRPALKETGLSYRHTQTQNQGIITIFCIITHAGGHSEISELSSNPDISGGKDPLKAMASAISYLKRYTLTGSLGIVSGGEDDDAQSVDISEKTEDGFLEDAEFEKNFSVWSKQITDGKKTAGEMVGFLNKKGVLFTEDQLDKIYDLENK